MTASIKTAAYEILSVEKEALMVVLAPVVSDVLKESRALKSVTTMNPPNVIC